MLVLVLVLMQMRMLMLMVVQLLSQVGRSAETAPVKKPVVQLPPQHVLVCMGRSFRGE